MPKGFGWRTSRPSDHWLVNDMIHDLVGSPPTGVPRVEGRLRSRHVPGGRLDAPVRTQLDGRLRAQPAGRDSRARSIPVFNALRGMGHGRPLHVPRPGHRRAARPDRPPQKWTPDHPVTLVSTVGHLHPGGLDTDLVVRRGNQRRTLFQLQGPLLRAGRGGVVGRRDGRHALRLARQAPGRRQLSVHATYDTRRASWYEVMGIMPVAVYDGTGAGGVGPFNNSLDPQGVLTHGHLAENTSPRGQSHLPAGPEEAVGGRSPEPDRDHRLQVPAGRPRRSRGAPRSCRGFTPARP